MIAPGFGSPQAPSAPRERTSAARSRVRLHAAPPDAGHLAEHRRHPVAVPGRGDGGRHHVLQLQPAVGGVQLQVAGRRAGDARRQPAVRGEPRHHLPVADEQVPRRRLRRHLAEVEEPLLPLRVVVHHRHPAPADAGVIGGNHRQCERCGHRGVHGMASLVQHLHGGGGGGGVGCGRHATPVGAIRPRVWRREEAGGGGGGPNQCSVHRNLRGLCPFLLRQRSIVGRPVRWWQGCVVGMEFEVSGSRGDLRLVKSGPGVDRGLQSSRGE